MNKVLKGWNWTEKFLIGLLAFSAVAFSFYTVIMRYAFKAAPGWGEEVIIYMIVWAVFLSASTLAEERGHVAATLLVERFPPKRRRLLAVINGLLAMGFCILICIWGYRIVTLTFLTDERSLTALRFPLWIPYLSVPAGCTLVAIRYLRRLYRLLFRFDRSEILEAHEMAREETHS